jgi:hypothetical protein
MIHSIKIDGYRTFNEFSVNGLGRINLLVGKNNTGKTSILETLHLLRSANNLSALWETLTRRGEQSLPEAVAGRPFQQEGDVAHFFTGHQMQIGSSFSISASNDSPTRSIRYQIVEAKPQENPALFNFLASQDPAGSGMALKISGSPNTPPIPLTRRGTLRADVYAQAFNMFRVVRAQQGAVQFVTTDSLSVPEVQQIWNDIALKPEEDFVIRALKFIDPEIERIASLATPFAFGQSSRGGFVVRRKREDRVPIGSFGDGIWRIFALAVALSRVKGGMLLIDEVDTGLHYTVMTEMWKFVNEISKTFDIQVVATTHSYDCVHSLATVCRDVEDSKSEITIHRIEIGKKESIRFTEKQIIAAADREIEIR